MAVNFNSFNSHPVFGSIDSSNGRPNFGLNDDAMDVQIFLKNNSSFGQNHVNGNGLTSSHPLLNSSNPTEPLHQNELMMISQRNQTSMKYGHGQLCARQRIADATRRSTYPAPRRVHVHSVIDYSPVQNQPGVHEVTVTEVVKTQFLTSNSTRDLLLATNDIIPDAQELINFPGRGGLLWSNQLMNQPESLDSISYHNGLQNQSNLPNRSLPVSNHFIMNHPFTIQSDQPFHSIYHQSSFHNQSNLPSKSSAMSSQVNHPPFNENESFQNVCHQNPTQNPSKPADFSDLADHSMPKSDVILDPVPMSCVFVAENPSDNQNQNLSHQQNPHQEQLDEYISATPTRVPSIQIKKVPRDQISINISADEDENGNNDGRTHSLPRCKDAPYVCPKCKEVFQTSQFFASHVSSAHYKYETSAERKRRLAAKFKNKKNFQLVQSSDGLTILPAKSKKKPGRPRKKAKRAAKTELIDQVKKQEEAGTSGTAAAGDFLVDVVIKEEYE